GCQGARPVFAGGGDVEVEQVAAAEVATRNLADGQRDATVDLTVGVVADDLAAVPLGAPDKALRIDRESVGDPFVAAHSDDDVLVRELAGAIGKVVGVDDAGGAVGVIQRPIIGAEAQAVRQADPFLYHARGAVALD